MRNRLKRTLLLGAVLQLLLSALALELTFFDVGQGLSVLISSPTGQKVLYDAGPEDANVAALLACEGVEQLNLLIASHGHADHIGGVPDVLANIGAFYYIDNGLPHTTETYKHVMSSARTSRAALLEPQRRGIFLGEVHLSVIPPPGDEGLGHNNNSIGLRIEYGEFAALLPGDAEPELWGWWLRQHADLLGSVQVMQASHHGSRVGDTPEALALLAPEVVIVSAGQRNVYEHPHAEAVAAYEAVGARVYGTNEYGTIKVRVEPDGSYSLGSPAPCAP